MAGYQVAVIGCGRMGVHYIEAYTAYRDCHLVAIVDPLEDRRQFVARRFDVRHHFPTVESLLESLRPDIVSVVVPTKYTAEAVIACASAGVRAISAEKPITATLADADAMLAACRSNKVVFSGGDLQRAKPELQHAAKLIREGRIGALQGACMWLERELSGVAVQPISVMRLLTGAEVRSAIGWIDPPEVAASESDRCRAQGILTLDSGLTCSVFCASPTYRGVDVWGREGLVRWNWGEPEVYVGADAGGGRARIDLQCPPYEYAELDYLTGALRGLIHSLETGSVLPVSGLDLCMAVEIAIALKESSKRGHVSMRLPLDDRSLTLMPVPYRWLGGDVTGGRYPDQDGRQLSGWPYETDELEAPGAD